MTANDPDGDAEPIATGDTGDAEPVVERPERAGRPPPRIVLDEIRESSARHDPAGEYVTFKNAGETALDLSGWTVSNAAGDSYRFPPRTVVEPGRRLTLHSGPGRDVPNHRY